MRIASGRADHVVALRIRGGRAIVQEDRLAGVEDLERVDLRAQAIERCAPHVVPPIDAEGVRDDHHSALVVDARDRLFAAQIARDGALEEEADDLAVTRADLLPDDDAKTLGELAQPQPAVDGVVVRGADDVDAGRTHAASLLGERRATVRRSLAVRVHVHANTLRLGSYGALPFSSASWTTARTRSRNRDTSKRRAESRSAFGSKRARSARRTPSAKARGSGTSTRTPSSPSRTMSKMPPAASATTGAPEARASTHTMPKSSSDGNTRPRADASNERRVASSARPVKTTFSLAMRSSAPRSRPSPTTRRRIPMSLNAWIATSARLYDESRPTNNQKSPRSSFAASEATSTGGWTTSISPAGMP